MSAGVVPGVCGKARGDRRRPPLYAEGEKRSKLFPRVEFIANKNCGIFVGIYGIVQSSVWLFLTLFLMTCGQHIAAGRKINAYWHAFHSNYVDINAGGHAKLVIYCFIYFILSLGMLILSINVLVKLYMKRSARCTYISWSVMTFVICVVDVIMSVVMTLEIKIMSKETMHLSKYDDRIVQEFLPQDPYSARLAAAISMFAFTSRFFLIWLLNFICALLLVKSEFSQTKLFDKFYPESPCDPCSPTKPCSPECPQFPKPPPADDFKLCMVQAWQ